MSYSIGGMRLRSGTVTPVHLVENVALRTTENIRRGMTVQNSILEAVGHYIVEIGFTGLAAVTETMRRFFNNNRVNRVLDGVDVTREVARYTVNTSHKKAIGAAAATAAGTAVGYVGKKLTPKGSTINNLRPRPDNIGNRNDLTRTKPRLYYSYLRNNFPTGSGKGRLWVDKTNNKVMMDIWKDRKIQATENIGSIEYGRRRNGTMGYIFRPNPGYAELITMPMYNALLVLEGALEKAWTPPHVVRETRDTSGARFRFMISKLPRHKRMILDQKMSRTKYATTWHSVKRGYGSGSVEMMIYVQKLIKSL